MSRLIKCVSSLYHERQERRLASSSLAENWSSCLQFELVETLEDDRIIFGVVYKWSREIVSVPFRPPDALEFVVAFRGTDIHESKDIITDLNILILFVKLQSDQKVPGPSSLFDKLLAVWHTTGQQIARTCGASEIAERSQGSKTF